MVSRSSCQIRRSLVGVWSPRLGGCMVLKEKINAVEVTLGGSIVERHPARHSVPYCRISPSDG